MGSDKPKRKKNTRPLLESGRLILYTLIAALILVLVVLLGLRLTPVQTMFAHLGFVSAITFVVFAVDKLQAKRSGRRASEFNMMALGALGGAAGALLAMAAFRHKTRHALFTVGLPTLLFVHVVVVAVVMMR